MYCRLSGISPFYSETPRDTLNKIKEGNWEFDKEQFANISADAKDLIRKLLVKDPK